MSTREKIINNLLQFPNSTVSDLAKAVNINGISVRHHLTHLIAEDLVCTEEIRHGVGRPWLVYRLTEAGMEQFPSKYLRLIKLLLQQIKSTLSEHEFNEIIRSAALSVTSDYHASLQNLTLVERLDFIKEVLFKEGFFIDWEEKDKNYIIHNYNCPYYHLVFSNPEICTFDKTIISNLLEQSVELIESKANGNQHCKYIVINEKG